jgi:hypothetical protein
MTLVILQPAVFSKCHHRLLWQLPAGGGIIGRLYEKFDVPVSEKGAFRNMHFADDHFGLIVGGSGILQSKDGGETWRALKSPSRYVLAAVFCTVGHRCWVGGGEDHVIFRRDDDLQSNWLRQDTPRSHYSATDVFFYFGPRFHDALFNSPFGRSLH